MPDLDTSNHLFLLAADMVNHSAQSIFITGKAGTGKTTFLKYIKEHCAKQIVITAPTGVAAINAGGTTLHSFFQLPLAPFIPSLDNIHAQATTEITTTHSLLSRVRFNAEKRKILQLLELLIIDEISMVRCDILDAIDTILRHFRNSHKPFGGVQVVLIGDMYQLPPVIREEEWNILSRFYSSPYFFSSHVIRQQVPSFISFEKIYRQNDEKFIDLLNRVRNNDMDEESYRLIDHYYHPGFTPGGDEGYIILTSHNYKADHINEAELQQLKSPLYSFKATINGEFAEKSFPADEVLQLKEGAVVMFIKNDLEKIRRYYNGKTGKVTKIDNEKIYVQCNDGEEMIGVQKEKWENIRYTLNKTSHQLEEEVMGSFEQFPLRLSWAITIHKSQGLTFEKAVIDAGEAFAPGQVYVALSRCTNLGGLVLRSKIKPGSLENDPRILAFLQNISSISQLQDELLRAKHVYQQSLLTGLFDFSFISKSIEDLQLYLHNNISSFNAELPDWIKILSNNFKQLSDVSSKFRSQLEKLFKHQDLPQENPDVQNRTRSAAIYFGEQLQQQLHFLQTSPAVTDSRLKAKEYNQQLLDIFSSITEKKFMMKYCEDGFDAIAWHGRRQKFILPPLNSNAYAGNPVMHTNETRHPALYQQLKKLRDEISTKHHLPIYLVAGTVTLGEMTNYLPQNMEELAKISGFGKAKLAAYGQQFLSVIVSYCEIHKIGSLIHEKIPKRQRGEKKTSAATNTKSETFQLHKSGKSVLEIAQIRNFTTQTIEGHLAHYVQTGEIKIDDLLSNEKVSLIEPVLKKNEGGSITAVKQQLGEKASFGDIRLVMAWRTYEQGRQKINS
jgi:ATP-dependent exoDNAse (exonuclease V), alpha subunit - helicase superfamily I member